MINLNNLKTSQTLLDNRYRLKDRIGGGGFSEVWLAFDERSRVDVVLKVYASTQDLGEEGVRMFRKEFGIVCNLNHSNILKPFTFDIHEGSPYIVLPFCEKGSAAGLIGKITEPELWTFAEQVAAGLAYLHRHNIIHQDIKPGNVLINADGQYLITDFGISTGLRNTIRKSSGTQNVAAGSGTTAYMSYECLAPKPVNVIARDIWAFGATLYELATGNVPFGEYGGFSQKAEKGRVPWVEGEWSDDMQGLIRECLAFNAWDRPGAEEILEKISRHKQGIKVPRKRHWGKPLAAAVAAVLVAGAGIWIGWPREKADEAARLTDSLQHRVDSLMLQRVIEAETIVRAEKKKANIAERDEAKLCRAANIYREAVSARRSDSTLYEGQMIRVTTSDTALVQARDRWAASQRVIDATYENLREMEKYYSSMEAREAAKPFARRCSVLYQYVTDSIKQN